MTILLIIGLYLGIFGFGASVTTVVRPASYKNPLLVWHAWIALTLSTVLVSLVGASL